MNKKEFLQVAEWIADGVCEYNYADSDKWIPDTEGSRLLMCTPFSQYRRKLSSKHRPWKPEEVPVGAIVRFKVSGNSRYLITALWQDKVCLNGANRPEDIWETRTMLNEYEHSLDHGKIWLPCGILES